MKFLLLIVVLLYAPLGLAVNQAKMQIEVQALMPGMVVLNVNQQRVTLKQGEANEQGLRLISADTAAAVIEVNGVAQRFTMGSAVSTQFIQPRQLTEQIMADERGMFRAHGSINGQSVRFLVDTGASSVAISATDARRLGIQYRLDGIPVTANTASGLAKGWRVRLNSVRLGQLLEKNVEAVVVDGDHPSQVLLGMTFLKRMRVDKDGDRMQITQTP
ncbi:MAG TPA: TIGR02281 family clan AA aspartic protease [Gammaproteobacteria bacterium]